jgi:beta-lactamase class A
MHFMRSFCRNLLVTCVAAATPLILAQEPVRMVQDPLLTGKLKAIVAAHHGKVALFAHQLNTGKFSAIDADLPVQTASTIKLAMLFHAMNEIAQGKAKWDEPITLQASDTVGGSGILNQFDTPLRITLKDVLTMMIELSDNTATNLAIDRFGVDAVNARMTDIGLSNTHLYKKVMKPPTGPLPPDQPKFGLGKTTAREIADLAARIGECRLHTDLTLKPTAAEDAVCKIALNMLTHQFYRDTIPRYLEKLDSSEGSTAIASKTGSLDATRSDVAILAGKTGPIVIAIYTYQNADTSWTADNEGEVTIGKLAREIVDAWSPAGLDAKGMIPGLGRR